MKVKIVKTKNKMLYISIILLIIKTFLSINRYYNLNDTADILLSLFIGILLAINIVRQNYSKKTIFIYFIICAISLVTCYFMGSVQILITVLIILAIRKENFNQIIAFIFQCECIFLILICCISFSDYMFTGNSLYDVIDGLNRYHFGFIHPNSFSVIVFNLILMWLWLNYEKIRFKQIMFLLFIEFIMFIFTKTRTTFILMLLITLLISVFSKRKKSKALSSLSAFMFPVVSILYLFLFKYYKSGNIIIRVIDELLTGRIRLAAYAYETVGLTFFGSNVLPKLGTVSWDRVYQLNSFTFDSIYSELWMYIGILTLLGLTIVFYILSRKQKNKINVFLIAWCLYGISEVQGINCFMCFPILLTYYLFDKNILLLNSRLDLSKGRINDE